MPTVHRYRYGSDPSQFVRLFLPDEGDRWPVVVVVHGGFWRAQRGAELAYPLAEDLTAHGVAAAAVEYRRVELGGGWPATMADVGRAVDELTSAGQRLAGGRLDLSLVAAVGHSAGGQLVGWLAHRPSLRVGTAGSVTPGQPFVPLLGAVSQGGVLDLVGAAEEGVGDGAVVDLMGGAPKSLPQRYSHSSPLAHVGDGARVVCVHGDRDDVVPLSQSQRYVAAAQAAGDPAELVVLPGVGHMELVDTTHPAWRTCREAVLGLL
ncbi:alpha/beta hydrolase family protein [Nakamurella endophytica]|uniref:BD-FAE-like domain-containing protein n=1 Tax=Nakamurella endophytica TaxID=1748367 RepID=A0A917SJK3_9ACTN|nr:alpha/beta hydrolase [Nakamurella endophytica]GGL84436.1 hypothetical protein GCM10011594_00100 [Nakamurella endophytica]